MHVFAYSCVLGVRLCVGILFYSFLCDCAVAYLRTRASVCVRVSLFVCVCVRSLGCLIDLCLFVGSRAWLVGWLCFAFVRRVCLLACLCVCLFVRLFVCSFCRLVV